MTDGKDIRRGFQSSWILVALGILYIVLFLALAFITNRPGMAPSLDTGMTPFVPAGSPEAEGWYRGADPAGVEESR